jgi:hypothetical protein
VEVAGLILYAALKRRSSTVALVSAAKPPSVIHSNHVTSTLASAISIDDHDQGATLSDSKKPLHPNSFVSRILMVKCFRPSDLQRFSC